MSHDGAADVSVASFNQNVSSENICSFFDSCHNEATNSFSIVAEDIDGAPATGFDVNVSRSSQTVDQVNDCQGTAPVEETELQVHRVLMEHYKMYLYKH